MNFKSSWSIAMLGAGVVLSGCVESGKNTAVVDTPTVDYVEFLNVEDVMFLIKSIIQTIFMNR